MKRPRRGADSAVLDRADDVITAVEALLVELREAVRQEGEGTDDGKPAR